MILFVTCFVPDGEGHGAAQRAMAHLRTLALLGPVDMVVIHRPGDPDVISSSLDPSEPYVRTAIKMPLAGWEGLTHRVPWIPYKLGLFLESLQMYCSEAPHLSNATWDQVAEQLPEKHYDLTFSFRISAAHTVNRLIKRKLITATAKLVDFDDIMSRYSQRFLSIERNRLGRFRSALWKLDVRRIIQAEKDILLSWDAVSVCSDDDVAILRQRTPSANIFKIPNAISRPQIPVPTSKTPRLLFVGSLTSPANIQGLTAFIRNAWPKIREQVPNVELTVVGLLPSADMIALLSRAGAKLQANAPSVQPFYEKSDIVICPIMFGSGTRIKILEAMAFGRPIVSTTLGAEGLGVQSGREMLIADTMPEFAQSVIQLCESPSLRTDLATRARNFQQALYSPDTFRNALMQMIGSVQGKRSLAA